MDVSHTHSDMSVPSLNELSTTILPISTPELLDGAKKQLKYLVESRSALNRLEFLNKAHHSNNQDILWHTNIYQVDMDTELPSFAQFIYERVERETIQEIHDSLHKCQCCKRHSGDPLIPGYGWSSHQHLTSDNLGGRCPCKCRHYRRQLREVIDFIGSI